MKTFLSQMLFKLISLPYTINTTILPNITNTPQFSCFMSFSGRQNIDGYKELYAIENFNKIRDLFVTCKYYSKF